MSLSPSGSKFSVVFSDKLAKRYKINRRGWENIALPMFGKHNVQNALAAVSVAIELPALS